MNVPLGLMFLVAPFIDLSLMRILAGQFMSFTRLNVRLSIFGSMVADFDCSFNLLSPRQLMPCPLENE
jgi:hypothetical protein